MTTTDTRGLCPPSPDYRTAETMRARCGELERQLAEARANVQHARDERDAERRLSASVREALGAPECVDVREWAQRVVERVAVAETNERGSAGTVTELLDRIGATHLDEACAVLWRQSQEHERTKRYLARALRGCDARERHAIETDMAAEVGHGG